MRAFTFVEFATVLWLASVSAGCAHNRNYARVSNVDPGKTRFETYCAGCHLNEGPWMMGEAPPLAGSSWIAGPESRAIKIVLHGLRGTIEVNGKTYNQEMPSFGPVLTDADIASLLSYARRRFGGVDLTISDSAVAAIRAANRDRKQFWTADELLKAP